MEYHSEAVKAVSPQSGSNYLEQLQKMCEIPCSNPRVPYLTAVDIEAHQIILVRGSCKLWSCPECSARNARKWIGRIVEGCNVLDTEDGWQMFTLTAHRKWRKSASVTNLRQGWKKLYNRLRYTFGCNHYCKVWEMHKDSSFHLHGLIDATTTQKWLKQNAVECGMGYQVDIHPVQNAGQVAGYIAKYFTKAHAVEHKDSVPYPKNLRRIEVSRSWVEFKEYESALQWLTNETREGQLRNVYHMNLELKYKVVDLVKL